MTEIIFDVDGFPPAKNEALSMFGEKHSHAPRVLRLLREAHTALGEMDFKPLLGPIGLEVVVRAPAQKDPWDATNYLGGIADVLQEKKNVRISLEHLGDLSEFALYCNDRQIREIHYRQEHGEFPAYRVRIWSLPDV
jgi:hypothetical protein